MKKITVLTSLAAFLIICIAATKPGATSEKKYGAWKNLKVLPQDISEDSLDAVMDHFKEALGVRCDFCHTHNGDNWDFASDDKESKEATRYMMKMTMELNQKYFNFDSTVSPQALNTIKCITCHRGGTRPSEADYHEEKKE